MLSQCGECVRDRHQKNLHSAHKTFTQCWFIVCDIHPVIIATESPAIWQDGDISLTLHRHLNKHDWWAITIDLMRDYCRASVADSGATLSQYWTNFFGSLVLFAVYLSNSQYESIACAPSIHVCIHPISSRYTDFSPHSQFAPFLVRRFAPNSYLGRTFRPHPINRKDVSPPFS